MYERGIANEKAVNRAFKAALEMKSLPAWVVGYRVATHKEQNRHIDGVIQTADVGDLKLQIKTTWKAADKLKDELGRMGIAVVNIHLPYVSDEEIIKRCLAAVEPFHQRYLSYRKTEE